MTQGSLWVPGQGPHRPSLGPGTRELLLLCGLDLAEPHLLHMGQGLLFL